MDLNTKVILKMGKKMVKVYLNGVMVIHIKVNFKKIKLVVLVYLYGLIRNFIKVLSKIAK